ncbi:FxsA family protein [Aciduricibacillus chroicocephali]|uniref:FxsA family protein n=1 Tax=Aciduricibacillus chroicocephali TaxID=3054939 RepID=A0ABY9KSH3_9BACI|nr:FxsA family protein [Bacillaceae bacterium 44XB]
MPWILILIFIIMPAIEIGVFVWIGGQIGAGWVVALIILSAVLGSLLARQQGMETWRRAQRAMAERRMPSEEIVDGICIFIGSVFLIAPGFVTDAFGLLLLLPITRRPFKKLIKKWLAFIIAKRTFFFRRF